MGDEAPRIVANIAKLLGLLRAAASAQAACIVIV